MPGGVYNLIAIFVKLFIKHVKLLNVHDGPIFVLDLGSRRVGSVLVEKLLLSLLHLLLLKTDLSLVVQPVIHGFLSLGAPGLRVHKLWLSRILRLLHLNLDALMSLVLALLKGLLVR